MEILKKATDPIVLAGANNHELDRFENQYIVPSGMCCNSHVISDDQIAVMALVRNCMVTPSPAGKRRRR